MPGSLQNKLQQFEVTPPPAVWNKIVEQLNEEFVPADGFVSSKIADTTVAPPAIVWDKISAELFSDSAQQPEKGRVVPINFKRIAIAAAVLGLIALALVYFSGDEKIQQPEVVQTTPVAPQQAPESKPLTAQANPQQKTESIAAVTVKKKTLPRAPQSIASGASYVETAYAGESPEEAHLYDLNTVSTVDNVSVSAPPLRDKSGNLIMDLATISAPNDPYIVVTGPNGKQTKISSKFLSCLGYMNANLSSSEMDSKAIRCTTQFEEWRRRLLSEPAFIPTANNFFDIFELKDMLQEM